MKDRKKINTNAEENIAFTAIKNIKLETKQKCEEYKKASEIKNKMAEQKCNIFETRKILGISRRKSCSNSERKKIENSRTNLRKEEETNTIRIESEESTITITRTQTEKKH